MFEDMFGYIQGLDFQIMALQAVNASSIDGDTIHHALGLNPFVKGDGGQGKNKDTGSKMQEAAKRIAQWKWIILDEVSMCSAEFLAQMDLQLRSIVSDVICQKSGKRLAELPFGGINIL